MPKKTTASVDAYSTIVTLSDGTWARMWMPSPADFRAMRELGTEDADVPVAVQTIFGRLATACIEWSGPKADTPIDEQPIAWLNDLIKGWLGTGDGGLPPESAAT